jgi:hypothetical protein
MEYSEEDIDAWINANSWESRANIVKIGVDATYRYDMGRATPIQVQVAMAF